MRGHRESIMHVKATPGGTLRAALTCAPNSCFMGISDGGKGATKTALIKKGGIGSLGSARTRQIAISTLDYQLGLDSANNLFDTK